ncbi:methyl-CpG-binding domain-containing protein 6 [Brassica rapa]|uniref:MBD domain-containing protein n=1 Tax=Brassica campestris TaxID=3711 RepID=M4CR77_BRACM|nr:methyl-CpG-binding domain-containing protein 6 [Brassica rapa]XP_013740296.1 methyl-CpG-binding domain-containing protein 6-like [Brassica napus]
MSNGTEQVNPSPDNSAHQSESKSRKRSAPLDNWLPDGWRVEDKVRTSGAKAGSVDKYYYEPVTGRRFRSRTEVLYYLEHGTSKKGSKKADFNPDHLEGQGRNKSSRKAKEQPPRPLNFDFENAPEKLSWSMANSGDEAWSPFLGEDKVQDSVRRDWCAAFTVVTTKNPSKLSL